jgi:enoyl-CoA hydratase
MSDSILVEHPADGVAVLRLNRPKVLNALDNATVEAIGTELTALAADGTTRAVVITGDERAFAAGGDIAEFVTSGPRLEAWDALWSTPLPLIAAVRGVALGGGLELAMSCDLLVVADDARLGQPEINLGIMPGAGGTQRLTRAVGKAIATEMVLLGRELSGRDAERHGLANRSVAAEAVLPLALELAVRLAAQAPGAVRAAKRAVAQSYEMTLHAALLDERRAFYALLASDDGREGVDAFITKRRPVWSNA